MVMDKRPLELQPLEVSTAAAHRLVEEGLQKIFRTNKTLTLGFGGGPFGGGAFGEMTSPLDAEIQVVLREIQTEVHQLENSGDYGEQFKNARRLLATGKLEKKWINWIKNFSFSEATKLENNIDPEWLEVDINKPIKVSKKVLIPSFRHPKVLFGY